MKLLYAFTTRNTQALLEVLSDDVFVRTDGGGRYHATLRSVHGASKTARFLEGLARKRTGVSSAR